MFDFSFWQIISMAIVGFIGWYIHTQIIIIRDGVNSGDQLKEVWYPLNFSWKNRTLKSKLDFLVDYNAKLLTLVAPKMPDVLPPQLTIPSLPDELTEEDIQLLVDFYSRNVYVINNVINRCHNLSAPIKFNKTPILTFINKIRTEYGLPELIDRTKQISR